jgi:hypothetical protein
MAAKISLTTWNREVYEPSDVRAWLCLSQDCQPLARACAAAAVVRQLTSIEAPGASRRPITNTQDSFALVDALLQQLPGIVKAGSPRV